MNLINVHFKTFFSSSTNQCANHLFLQGESSVEYQQMVENEAEVLTLKKAAMGSLPTKNHLHLY